MFDELYELVPGAARGGRLGALSRRPGPGGGQLAGGRAKRAARQVECAINGIGERAGNASLEEIVMLLHTREPSLGLWTGVETTRDRAHEPAGLAADRLPGAAEQGDRRAQRVRARGGHPPGRRAEGAHHLRDHGCDHGRPAQQLDRAGQALRPPRAARSAGGDGLPDRRSGAEHRVQALQGDRRPQEAGDRDGPGGARDRRAARGDRRLRARVVRGRGLLAAARRTRASSIDAARRRLGERLIHRRGPIDAVFQAINAATGDGAELREFTIGAVTEGQDALGEVSVVVELDGFTGAGQGVSTDIIDAAARAYVRALSVAVARCAGRRGDRAARGRRSLSSQ